MLQLSTYLKSNTGKHANTLSLSLLLLHLSQTRLLYIHKQFFSCLCRFFTSCPQYCGFAPLLSLSLSHSLSLSKDCTRTVKFTCGYIPSPNGLVIVCCRIVTAVNLYFLSLFRSLSILLFLFLPLSLYHACLLL